MERCHAGLLCIYRGAFARLAPASLNQRCTPALCRKLIPMSNNPHRLKDFLSWPSSRKTNPCGMSLLRLLPFLSGLASNPSLSTHLSQVVPLSTQVRPMSAAPSIPEPCPLPSPRGSKCPGRPAFPAPTERAQ